MKPAELIETCIKGYKTFNSNKMTIDAHLEVFLADIGCSEESDSVFIKQVVYGCLRFKKLNKVTLTALYFKHGTQVSREDYPLYMVFSYLTLLRLEDMGIPVFRKFVYSQDHHKMFVWLSFIFNAQTLTQWLKEEWCRIFDEQYVEDELIARLLRNLPEVSEVIERLRELASTREADDVDSQAERKKAATTKVEPFNLTRPRPRATAEPMPIKIENPYTKPIPRSVLDPAGDGTALRVEEARRRAHEETAARAARARAPELETGRLPARKVVRAGKYKDALRAEAEREEELRARYVPPAPADPAPALRAAEGAGVRLNAAAVLREDALLRRKQMEEAAAIRKYEAELRDDSAFYEWQARMRDRDERKRLEEVEERRVDMLLTDDKAREARLQNERDNQRFAAEMRREGAAIRAMHKAEQEEALVEKRSLVEDVKASERAAGAAVAAAAEARAAAAMEVREEARRLEEAKRERARREEEQRMDMVRQIRALESLPPDRSAGFDPTTVSEETRHVLEAMSYAELEERLALAARLAKEREETRRMAIIADRQAKEEGLQARVDTIQRVRAVRERDAAEARRRKAEREAEEARVRAEIREAAQARLQAEMDSKRRGRLDEEARLKEEMRLIEIKKQFLAAGAAQMEEKKFKELESGAERKIRDQQAKERTEHEAYLLAMSHEDRNRTLNLERRAEAKKVFVSEFDTNLRLGKADMLDTLATSMAEKRQTVALTRDASSALKDRTMASDPNKHQVNLASIQSSRSFRNARLSQSPSRTPTAGATAAAAAGGLPRDTVTARARLLREATEP